MYVCGCVCGEICLNFINLIKILIKIEHVIQNLKGILPPESQLLLQMCWKGVHIHNFPDASSAVLRSSFVKFICLLLIRVCYCKADSVTHITVHSQNYFSFISLNRSIHHVENVSNRSCRSY
jgi:hypothetical protein